MDILSSHTWCRRRFAASLLYLFIQTKRTKSVSNWKVWIANSHIRMWGACSMASNGMSTMQTSRRAGSRSKRKKWNANKMKMMRNNAIIRWTRVPSRLAAIKRNDVHKPLDIRSRRAYKLQTYQIGIYFFFLFARWSESDGGWMDELWAGGIRFCVA